MTPFGGINSTKHFCTVQSAGSLWAYSRFIDPHLELSHISSPRKTGSKSANPIRRSNKFCRSAHGFAVHFQILRRSSHPRRNWYLGERINLTCNSDKNTRARSFFFRPLSVQSRVEGMKVLLRFMRIETIDHFLVETSIPDSRSRVTTPWKRIAVGAQATENRAEVRSKC